MKPAGLWPGPGSLASRWTFPAMLGLAVLALSGLMVVQGWEGAWRLWNIPVMMPHFADARTIAAAGESFALGFDPLVQNPQDPWGRPLSYPRIWQSLFLLGLDQSHTTLLGSCMVVMLLVGLLTFVERPDLQTGLLLITAALSPAVLLGVERGNNDLFVFGLLGLALLALRRERIGLGLAIVFFASLLKLFVAFALIAFLPLLGRPETRRQLSFVLLGLGFYFIWSLADLQLIRAGVLKGTHLSFGVGVLQAHLGSIQSVHAGWIGRYALVLALALPLMVWSLSRLVPATSSALPETVRSRMPAFLAGVGIYYGSFLLGHNWDYRLLFLMLCLPMLAAISGEEEGLLKWLARLAILLILGSLWSFALAPEDASLATFVVVDEVINWLLVGGLLQIAALVLMRNGFTLLLDWSALGRRIGSLDLWQAVTLLLFAWLVLATFNLWLHGFGVRLDTPLYFPFSIFIPGFHLSGMNHAVLTMVLLLVLVQNHRNLSLLQLWLGGSLAMVSGNLIQGGFDPGFLHPFVLTDYQYYHEALGIQDWRQWLTDFNGQQEQLLVHSKTHPPFAVLLHLPFIPESGNRPVLLALVFAFLSSLSLVLFFRVLRWLGWTKERANLGVLLLAFLPAFNIYSIASLDGVILSASLLILAGMVRVWVFGVQGFGLAMLGIGLLLVNLLSFGGTFWLAFSLLLSILLWRQQGEKHLVQWMGFLFSTLAVLFVLMKPVFGYDHLQAFLVASRVENPGGFLLIAHPLEYLMTRLEGLLELLIFASLPLAGWLLIQSGSIRLVVPGKATHALAINGLLVLLAMFLTGAFRTGETARACLFMYPLLLVLLEDESDHRLRQFVQLAGVQTVLMQLAGSYFW